MEFLNMNIFDFFLIKQMRYRFLRYRILEQDARPETKLDSPGRSINQNHILITGLREKRFCTPESEIVLELKPIAEVLLIGMYLIQYI